MQFSPVTRSGPKLLGSNVFLGVMTTMNLATKAEPMQF